MTGVLLESCLGMGRNISPSPFVITVNVEDSAKGRTMLEATGFQTREEKKVRNELLPGFGLRPKDDKILRAWMGALPQEVFCVSLAQWERPKSERWGQEQTCQFTVAVESIAHALVQAKAAGF